VTEPLIPDAAAPARTSWQRHVIDPIAVQLTQGITPEKIALTLAVGSAFALFPILGLSLIHISAEAVHEGLAEARVEISGVMPPNIPMPPLPPMTGGKIVSGTLNGGGVEIQAATLNGDIVLKKVE